MFNLHDSLKHSCFPALLGQTPTHIQFRTQHITVIEASLEEFYAFLPEGPVALLGRYEAILLIFLRVLDDDSFWHASVIEYRMHFLDL